MVTECQLKPISMNFSSPRNGRGFCVEGMVQDLIGQKKKTNLAAIYVLLICCNKVLIRAMLTIYYGISSSTFCQNLMSSFRSMHLISQKKKFKILQSYLYLFPATEFCAQICRQSCWDILLNCLSSLSFHSRVLDMKKQYIFKLILFKVSLCSV